MTESINDTHSEILVDPMVANGQSAVYFAFRSPENILFLLGKEVVEDMESLQRDIPFSDLMKKDPGLSEIRDLPPGHRAHRTAKDSEWHIAELNPRSNTGEYMDGYLEWIQKLYVDGYYTGGKVPYWYTHPGKPGLYGWVSLLLGVIIFGTTFLVSFLNQGAILKKALGPAILGAGLIVIGILVLMRTKPPARDQENSPGDI